MLSNKLFIDKSSFSLKSLPFLSPCRSFQKENKGYPAVILYIFYVLNMVQPLRISRWKISRWFNSDDDVMRECLPEGLKWNMRIIMINIFSSNALPSQLFISTVKWTWWKWNDGGDDDKDFFRVGWSVPQSLIAG